MKKILLFNISAKKAALIRQAASGLELSFTEVPPSQFGSPVGLLLGEKGYRAFGRRESFSEEMLVMEELSSPLLDALRSCGATVALKAVATQQNKAWSPARLCRELRREHEALRRQLSRPPRS